MQRAICEWGRTFGPHEIPRDKLAPCPEAASCGITLTDHGVATGELIFLCPGHFETVVAVMEADRAAAGEGEANVH